MTTTAAAATSPQDLAWQETLSATSAHTRQRVQATVHAMAETLAEAFYAALLSDPQARPLLDPDTVGQRLHASLARWLRLLFSVHAPLEERVALQRQTGEAHARIGVSNQLVARAARVLKRSITQQLVHDASLQADLALAVSYVHELIDLAVDEMDAACSRSASRMARSEEAYRLYFLSHNLKAERERQKLQLLEWAQQILVRHYWEVPPSRPPLPPLPAEPPPQFVMWLRHKATILFEGAAEIDHIQEHIAAIETDLLPRLCQARASHEDARALVAEINLSIERIKTLLGSMFDRCSEAEDGRDAVTNLLNRRYLPSVARREIGLALTHTERAGLAMLVIDIDGFQRLNDALGLEASDVLLQQVGAILIEHLRAGDFVFRIGDDQFLALVVDCPAASLPALADGLRQRIAATRLRTPDHASTFITVSIGAAPFGGDPDYQRLLDRATDAMRQAKQGGRNRCVTLG